MTEFIAGVVVGGLVVSALSYFGTVVIEKYFGRDE